ncbi:unnamed protein product [Owenia fusiformis]|uniref:Uncharacterized protein n=1 Tax=Owenia fusiformis TaxID=6347 RepID=A0A8S4NPV8_OWEFU|nr:unnamed protein product [Owenia fusiformis]
MKMTCEGDAYVLWRCRRRGFRMEWSHRGFRQLMKELKIGIPCDGTRTLALAVYLKNEFEIDYSVVINGVTANEVYAFMTTANNMETIHNYTLRTIPKDHRRHQDGSESVTWTTYTHYPGFPFPTFFDDYLTLFPAKTTIKHNISSLMGMLQGELFYYCSDTSDGTGVVFRERSRFRVSKLFPYSSERITAGHVDALQRIKGVMEEKA